MTIYAMLADGFEEVEALAVADVCLRAGIQVKLVSIMGRDVVQGAHGIRVTCEMQVEQADFDACDMIFLPGGMPGTNYLYECQLLKDKIEEFAKAGKYLSAICAAPSILGRMGLLEGKEAICFPGFEEKLLGAKVIAGAKVVKSGNIFTSRGMGTAIDLGLAIVEEVCSSDAAEKLAETIQYH